MIEQIGFFGEDRLTEDIDLTVSIYEHGYRIKYDVTSITEHEAPDTVKNYILQHLRWNRGFNEVSRNHWRRILNNKKMPFLRRLEALLFSLGYLDRMFFLLAFLLTFISVFILPSFNFPTWVWLFFLGIPALQILAALINERERFSMYLRLPIILSMFTVDIFVTLKAFYEDLTKKPTKWYKTPRVRHQAKKF